MSLTIGRDADDVLCIEGVMPEKRTASSSVVAKRAGPARRADPFPQALDAEPDHMVASLPQVAADSKPKLAEMVGVLPPTLAAEARRA